MSILLVMLGISVSQYQTYERRNNLILLADSVRSFIESARNEASSRVYTDSSNYNPNSCNQIVLKTDPEGTLLSEYRMIDLQKSCTPIPGLSNKLEIHTPTNGISITGDLNIIYLAPKGTLNAEAPIAIELKNQSGEQINITINEKSIATDRTGF